MKKVALGLGVLVAAAIVIGRVEGAAHGEAAGCGGGEADVSQAAGGGADPDSIAVHDTAELSGATTFGSDGIDPAAAWADTAIAVASSMKRYLRTDPLPFDATTQAKISLAGGEYESFQIIVKSEAYFPKVFVEVEDLVGDGEDGAVLDVEWFQVGFVKIRSFEGHLGYEDGLRPGPLPPGGWYPDPLLRRTTAEFWKGWTHSIWVTIKAPRGAPGSYTGQVKLTVGEETKIVDVEATVYDFDLPAKPALGATFGVYKPHLDRAYGADMNDDLRRAWLKALVDYRLQPSEILKGNGVSNTTDEDELKAHIKAASGKSEFPVEDYEAIRNDLHQFVAHRIVYGWHTRHPKDGADYDTVALNQLWFDSQLENGFLKKFEQAGLIADSGGFFYSWDEAQKERLRDDTVDHFRDMKEVHGHIRKSTLGHVPIVLVTNMLDGHDKKFSPDEHRTAKEARAIVDQFNELDADVLVTNIERWDLKVVRKLHKAGKKHWGYITFRPLDTRPNWRIDNELIDARVLLGALAYHQLLDGFLFWAVNAWTGGDHNDSRHDLPSLIDENASITVPTELENKIFSWLQGGGILLYPGETRPIGSMRFENIRDGIEDYDYFHLLKTTKTRKGRNKSMRVARKIAPSFWNYTVDGKEYYEHRDDLAAKILK